ncbi:hypothetical protein [Salana multivorans]
MSTPSRLRAIDRPRPRPARPRPAREIEVERLALGDPVGPRRFDPVVAWRGDLLVHVHRVPRAGAVGIRRAEARLAALGPDAAVRRPRLVVETGPQALAVVAVPDAVPLAVATGSGPWFTTTTAQALLGDLARAVSILHSCGVTAGWIGPESVLVDSFGRASLDVALSIGRRRPDASPNQDVTSLAILAGWLAQREDLRFSVELATLLDAALLDRVADSPAGPSRAADWLSRLAEVTGVDRERTGHILDLRDAADRRLLDAISERWRDTVLAAPDQPRSPRWRFSRRRREPPRRWSGW